MLRFAPFFISVAVLSAQPQRYPVRRLRPSAFRELPDAVRLDLERRDCTVPQPSVNRRENVIRGPFARPGQTDWAVLCSAAGYESILVFWNGSGTDAARIAHWPSPPETVIYDRFIAPAGRKYIVDHYRGYGGPKPPPIDHQGIESGGEKASVILYFYRGKWLTLQGAD
jgi:hypothetical protein